MPVMQVEIKKYAEFKRLEEVGKNLNYVIDNPPFALALPFFVVVDTGKVAIYRSQSKLASKVNVSVGGAIDHMEEAAEAKRQQAGRLGKSADRAFKNQQAYPSIPPAKAVASQTMTIVDPAHLKDQAYRDEMTRRLDNAATVLGSWAFREILENHNGCVMRLREEHAPGVDGCPEELTIRCDIISDPGTAIWAEEKKRIEEKLKRSELVLELQNMIDDLEPTQTKEKK